MGVKSGQLVRRYRMDRRERGSLEPRDTLGTVAVQPRGKLSPVGRLLMSFFDLTRAQKAAKTLAAFKDRDGDLSSSLLSIRDFGSSLLSPRVVQHKNSLVRLVAAVCAVELCRVFGSKVVFLPLETRQVSRDERGRRKKRSSRVQTLVRLFIGQLDFRETTRDEGSVIYRRRLWEASQSTVINYLIELCFIISYSLGAVPWQFVRRMESSCSQLFSTARGKILLRFRISSNVSFSDIWTNHRASPMRPWKLWLISYKKYVQFQRVSLSRWPDLWLWAKRCTRCSSSLWSNVLSLVKWAPFSQMGSLWSNVLSLVKCTLWSNLLSYVKWALFGQMGSLWSNVLFCIKLHKCSNYSA